MLIGHPAQNHPQQIRQRGPSLFADYADPTDDTDDRRTPADLLAECAALAGVDGFDLDPAATAESAKAPAFYTAADNGLRQPWWGRVWCNPPYSNVGEWVTKAHLEAPNCDTIAMLLPANRTEQAWWQHGVEPYRRDGSLPVFFLARRRRFDRRGWVAPAKGDRPPFGLCLVVWREAG